MSAASRPLTGTHILSENEVGIRQNYIVPVQLITSIRFIYILQSLVTNGRSTCLLSAFGHMFQSDPSESVPFHHMEISNRIVKKSVSDRLPARMLYFLANHHALSTNRRDHCYRPDCILEATTEAYTGRYVQNGTGHQLW
ncbi:uncharacterized protein LOC131683325 [Topomyia yanbarensis]|uniref:uncharacterized protein LOC131683325 n=1 Tax=Topomyia yanbarensis TaxID=2498891 RepID=UPI00273C7690|nr:uncharacterized protein LOC131683325 [Topomyia yanbarensis]